MTKLDRAKSMTQEKLLKVLDLLLFGGPSCPARTHVMLTHREGCGFCSIYLSLNFGDIDCSKCPIYKLEGARCYYTELTDVFGGSFLTNPISHTLALMIYVHQIEEEDV